MAQYIAGFIGAGNMGGALATAAVKQGAARVAVADKDTAKAEALAASCGCVATDNATVATQSQFVFLAVKPQLLDVVGAELKPLLARAAERVVLVSMLAGVDTKRLADVLGDLPIIRIMPNTPCAVGEGMILYTANETVTEEEKQTFLTLLSSAGQLDELPESLIDAGSALSGCGPAFVYLFTEALAEAGVKCGLSPEKALAYASQTVCGAGKMTVVDGRHPSALKDAVCSPGGSTIEGVHVLEDDGLRELVAKAVAASFKRTKELGK